MTDVDDLSIAGLLIRVLQNQETVLKQQDTILENIDKLFCKVKLLEERNKNSFITTVEMKREIDKLSNDVATIRVAVVGFPPKCISVKTGDISSIWDGIENDTIN